MLTNLNIYLSDGTELTYLEFEVHKDPIRTIHSDGVQYRIKLRGDHPLPEIVSHTGLVELYDTTSPYFWLKKCIRVGLGFKSKGKDINHSLYLLPMSIQNFQNNTIQLICMDISEKIMDLDINKSVLRIGGDDFTTYFKKRIQESNDYLNNSFDKAKKLLSGTNLNLKNIKILVQERNAEINRSNNTIISGTTMQLATYLIGQGWFECPNYGLYDSFNLETIETNPDMYSMEYYFLNLGDLKNRGITPELMTSPLSIGDTKTLSQFFKNNLMEALNIKNATFDFTKGGGYNICMDDGNIAQDTNTRIEMNVIAGSTENTEIKLCCLKQLVNINPRVYTGSFAGYLPLKFRTYTLSLNLIDLPIVINYLFKPMSPKETGNENFTVTTKFETLRIDTSVFNRVDYNDLAINGVLCSTKNSFN